MHFCQPFISIGLYGSAFGNHGSLRMPQVGFYFLPFQKTAVFFFACVYSFETAKWLLIQPVLVNSTIFYFFPASIGFYRKIMTLSVLQSPSMRKKG